MSWKLDGYEYHNYSEYQRAVQEQDRRRAQGEVDTLRREAERHAQRAREAEEGLRQARGDIAKQRLHQQALESSVAELRRTQRQMEQTQRAMEAEMDQKFRTMRDDLAKTNEQVIGLGCAIDTTQQGLDHLESEHQRHVDAVRKEFVRAGEELTRELAEAEQRRVKGEAALRQEIQSVDSKVEADRAARLAKADGEAGRARALADFIEERLPQIRHDQEALELQAEVGQIEESLGQARTELESGDTSLALTLVAGAYTNLRKAEKLALSRRAELSFVVERMNETIADLRAQMDQKDASGNNLIRDFFAQEATHVDSILARIESRIPVIYARHRQVFGQKPTEETDLDDLREMVRGLSVAAPQIHRFSQVREDRVERILRNLQSEFGHDTSIQIKLVDENDPKSVVQLDCDFGGRLIRVLIPIEPDAKIQIDGSGHNSNAECGENGARMGRVLARSIQITGVQIDQRARSAPEIEAQPQRSSWISTQDKITSLYRRTHG